MSHEGFRLDIEPWIMVRFLDGSAGEVSLRDAFRRADEIRVLDGETPTQVFAILRLMLAVLYRSQHGRTLDEDLWEQWWESGLPSDDVDGYLDRFADRFDLVGERPFMQVADLETASGESKGVGTIIFDLPSNNRLFANRAGEGAADLSLAEAARWLVNAQAWEPSGIKSGALGDARVKGGKGYPIGVGWCGLLGGVYAEGATLRQTLLLNLVPYGTAGLSADADADLPPWEDTTPDTAAERDGLLPCGPVRLYTWQSRRIRLFRSPAGRVVGCLVANGDRSAPQNEFRHEPMTAWRFSEPQTKKFKVDTYMPRTHAPQRALWRGISALIPRLARPTGKRSVPDSKAPGIVEWLAILEGDEVLDAAAVRLRAVGVVYGSNNSVVDDILSDSILMPLALLREEDRALAAQADEAVRLADTGVRHLRDLADNLARAAGSGDADGERERAGVTAYAALDGPYRRWLASLKTGDDPMEAIAGWKVTAYRILSDLGMRLVTESGPAAWVGREVTRSGRTDVITTPRAEGWFRRALAKTFGAPDKKEEAA